MMRQNILKEEQDKEEKRRNDLIINNRKCREKKKQKFQELERENVVVKKKNAILKEENNKLKEENAILKEENNKLRAMLPEGENVVFKEEEKFILKEENYKLRAELEKLRRDHATLQIQFAETQSYPNRARHEIIQPDSVSNQTSTFDSCRQRPTAILDSLAMDDLSKLSTSCHNKLDKVKKQERDLWLSLRTLCEKLVENGTASEKVNDWKLKSEEILKKAELKADITSSQVECQLLDQIIQYDCRRILGNLKEIGCSVSYISEKQIKQ